MRSLPALNQAPGKSQRRRRCCVGYLLLVGEQSLFQHRRNRQPGSLTDLRQGFFRLFIKADGARSHDVLQNAVIHNVLQ
jgi:hypothetical protein